MSNVITFEEKVRGIGKKEDSNDYHVIFKTRAAFYWIKGEKKEELIQLENAGKTSSTITISCDGITREILTVK